MKAEKTDYPGVTYRLKDNDRVYYIRYRRGGREAPLIEEPVGSSSRGMTPAKASHIRADRITGKALSNKEKREQQQQRPAIRWTIERLYDALKVTLNNAQRYEDVYFRHIAEFHDRAPDAIAQMEVDALRARLISEKSKSTARHALSVLSRIVNYGVKAGLIEQPRLIIKPPKVDAERTENMNDDQLERYLAALAEEKDVYARVFLLLSLHTGARRGALLKMKWEDIDFAHGFITLRGDAAKNEETTKIPMNNAAREALEMLPQEGDFLFPGKDGGHREDFRRVKIRVRDKAGLPPDWRPSHGLRHTYASRLASSGEVDPYTLQKLMTHKDIRMTQRYAHLSDEAMKRAAAVAASVMSRPRREETSHAKENLAK